MVGETDKFEKFFHLCFKTAVGEVAPCKSYLYNNKKIKELQALIS